MSSSSKVKPDSEFAQCVLRQELKENIAPEYALRQGIVVFCTQEQGLA